ncbi:MAG: D-2-hydroxyacid dehydrogenase [Hyphomicrobiaceae bacterium]
MRIVFLDRDSFAPSVRLDRPGGAHEWVEHARSAPEEVAERLAEADIAITNKAPIRQDAIASAPRLRMIAVTATGYDCVDTAAAKARGIVVSNVTNYATETVPEHVFALILALRRSIVGYRADVVAGHWQTSPSFCLLGHPIRNLAGATLGIIGAGAIGRAVQRIGAAFGMQTLLAARKGAAADGPYTAFDDVLARSDILTLHCPLTPATRNLIALPELRKMSRRPLLINTARGGLVDEADLVRALDEGLVSGIGFDCLSREPPSADNPLLAVAGRANVILTPHVAWASEEAMQALWDQSLANIAAFLAGSPRNVVDR